jgi:hypothetical protein
MPGPFLICFFIVLLGTTQLFGATQYRLGGPDGNAWQATLTAASAYQVLDTDGQPLRQVPVGLPLLPPGPIP